MQSTFLNPTVSTVNPDGSIAITATIAPLTNDQIQSIIDNLNENITGLTGQLADLQAQLAFYQSLQPQFQQAQAASAGFDNWNDYQKSLTATPVSPAQPAQQITP